MSYEEKFYLAEKSLIKSCKKSVSDNYNKMFDMWLMCEADMEFGHAYQDIFKKHFGEYITEGISSQLWFAGKNIIYAIKSYISIKKGIYHLEELLDFVETFVTEQIRDFDNDYDTSEWFNDEIDTIEETKEDIPQ